MCKQKRNRKKWKNHLLYKRAEDKVFGQLDVVNILRWIEQLKLLTKGLLNNKQKFWLKFQKEHILEIDRNSDVERIRKRKEVIEEETDFIKSLHIRDPKSKKKVDKMLKYLQHANRTTFDQKIIRGLFEEYCSDSEEEDQINKVMDTEEERKEFYSLSLAPDVQPRKREFNKGKTTIGSIRKLDFEPLRNLYNNQDSISRIGMTAQANAYSPKNSNHPSGRTNKTKVKSKRTMINKSSPLSQLTEKKVHHKKKKSNLISQLTKSADKFADRVQKINE